MECHHLAFGFIFHCAFCSHRNNHIWLTFRWLHWIISAINLGVIVINGIGSKTWPMVTSGDYNRTSPCGHPPKRQTKLHLTWPFVPVQVLSLLEVLLKCDLLFCKFSHIQNTYFYWCEKTSKTTNGLLGNCRGSIERRLWFSSASGKTNFPWNNLFEVQNKLIPHLSLIKWWIPENRPSHQIQHEKTELSSQLKS